MGKATARKRKVRDHIIGPTEEQQQRGSYGRVGIAFRRVPVIDQMLERDQITPQEHKALAHYRDQAHLSERSPTKSCLDQRIGGGGDIHLSAAVVSALLETGRIERDLGQLLDIARWVAVEDKTLSQWCIERHGGRERYDGKGRFIALVPVSEKRVMDMARMELRMAARRIVA